MPRRNALGSGNSANPREATPAVLSKTDPRLITFPSITQRQPEDEQKMQPLSLAVGHLQFFASEGRGRKINHYLIFKAQSSKESEITGLVVWIENRK